MPGVADFRKSFFDRAAVADKIPPAMKRALSRFGAYVRQKAKASLKYGDKSSTPGQPPIVHRSKGFTRKKKKKGVTVQQPSSPLRELIFFGYDSDKMTVVIGPAFGGSHTGAPEALEHGGSARVTNANGSTEIVTIGARPFMQPAFDKQLKAVGNDFKNLIR